MGNNFGSFWKGFERDWDFLIVGLVEEMSLFPFFDQSDYVLFAFCLPGKLNVTKREEMVCLTLQVNICRGMFTMFTAVCPSKSKQMNAEG